MSFLDPFGKNGTEIEPVPLAILNQNLINYYGRKRYDLDSHREYFPYH